MGGTTSLVLCALFALLLPLALADECDRYLSDCGNCLKSPGCGWCTVGGFKFCVDKTSGFCREDEWATTCDATHNKVQARLSGDAPECAALEAVKPCKSLSMLDCNSRISTDCVACVLTAADATCEDFVNTVYGTTAPPTSDFNTPVGGRWARQGFFADPYSDNYYYYSNPYYSNPYYTSSPYYTSAPPPPPSSSPSPSPPPPSASPTPPLPSETVADTTPPPTTPAPTESDTPRDLDTTAPPLTNTLGPTAAPPTPAPIAFCSARFVGSAGANFIKGFLAALIKIAITCDGLPNADDINCRADVMDLILNEFNLWMTVEITKRGGEDDEWHLAKVINFNVFLLDKNVARTRQDDGVDDLATTFAIANFSEEVVRKFASLFENGGAGLLGPLKGKITSVTVTASADTTGKRKKSDINGGELAAIIAVVSVFICMICVGLGYLLFRRSQLGKAPFAAAQASGPQR